MSPYRLVDDLALGDCIQNRANECNGDVTTVRATLSQSMRPTITENCDKCICSALPEQVT